MRVHEQIRERQIEALNDLLRRHGLKATQIAKRAGVSPSTVTRKLTPEDSSVFDTATFARLFAAVGEEPPALVSGALAPALPASAPADGREIAPFRPNDVGEDIDVAVRATIAGRQHLSAWTVQTRALDGLGYRPGDVVVVNASEPPRSGDVGAASLLDLQSPNRAQSVLRVYHDNELIASSSEPAYLKPIPVDSRWVTIRGVVEMLFRPRARWLPGHA